MTELQDLTIQRDGILARIREIETTCEGIENENNANIVQKLNLEQAQLSVKKNEIQANMEHVVKGPRGYVARSGSANSYCRDLRCAQRYKTREEAQRNCCCNEHPVPFYQERDSYFS